jgi:NAD-dependent SIR2 family protein deacetylase
MAIDTHHIAFQCTANKHNFIGNLHKNHMSNLIPVCKPCHQLIHKDVIVIKGYVMSTKGVILQ